MTRTTRTFALSAALAFAAFTGPAAFACEGDGHKTGAEAQAPQGAQTVSYTVNGMTCTGCSEKVEAAIRKLPGIYTVSVDIGKKTAKVAFDPAKVKPEQIKEAISKAGYKPAVVA